MLIASDLYLQLLGIASKLDVFGIDEPVTVSQTSLKKVAQVTTDTTNQDGYLAGLAQLLLSILREQPLGPVSENYAVLALGLFAQKFDAVLDLGDAGTIPAWLMQVAEIESPDRAQVMELIKSSIVVDFPTSIPVPGRPGRGLKAAIGCAISGHDASIKSGNAGIASKVATQLREWGFKVQDPVFHDPDKPHVACDLELNVDLFVAIVTRPSTRLGSQVQRCAGLLTRVLVLAPTGTELSCLFDSPELGDVTVKPFVDENAIPAILSQYVKEKLNILNRHADSRVDRDEWNRPLFLEARHAVNQGKIMVSPGEDLLTDDVVHHAVSSIDAFSAQTITTINSIFARYGSTPVRPPSRKDPVAYLSTLLPQVQQTEFRHFVKSMRVAPDEQLELLEFAVNELCSSAGGGKTLRSNPYRTTPDWQRALQQVRRRRSHKRSTN